MKLPIQTGAVARMLAEGIAIGAPRPPIVPQGCITPCVAGFCIGCDGFPPRCGPQPC